MGDPHLSASGRDPVDIAFQIAVGAGQTLMQKFDEHKEIASKGKDGPVTDVDIQVEFEIISQLMVEYPYDGFLAEESNPVDGITGYTWIIDPLDGTRNYVMGIPFFSLVIALAHEGEVVFGLTYDPVRQEMFHALRGEGSYLNNIAIHTSGKRDINDALLGYDLGGIDQKASTAIEMVLHLWPQLQGTRILGSSALGLAYISCGRLDIYFHHNLSAWDSASGTLLVREAGGVVTDKYNVSGGLLEGGIIAANPSLHQGFLDATTGLAWRA